MSTQLIRQTDSNDEEQATTTIEAARRARIVRDGDGQSLGCAVWLSGDDLRALGVELKANSPDAVGYSVRDGEVQITRAKPDREVSA